jgi:CBS domain-containing protein
MAELGMRERMLVKDIMTSPVITVSDKTLVDEIAQLMDRYNVSGIVVAIDDDNPLGIITERDLVTRVLAKNIQPSKSTSKEVMSSPLVTIGPEESLTEAARKMNKLKVKRLGVLYKEKLVGIVSAGDVLAVTPDLLEIIQEKAQINEANHMNEDLPKDLPTEGYCEDCNAWSEDLKEIDGNLLCEECRIELES